MPQGFRIFLLKSYPNLNKEQVLAALFSIPIVKRDDAKSSQFYLLPGNLPANEDEC